MRALLVYPESRREARQNKRWKQKWLQVRPYSPHAQFREELQVPSTLQGYHTTPHRVTVEEFSALLCGHFSIMMCQSAWFARPFGYEGPTFTTSPAWIESRACAQAGMSGNKFFMRFDFAQRIKMDTLLPVMFCWYLIFRSLVSSTFHRPSASVRSSPFFLDPKPACRTVWHSWPSAVIFSLSAAGRHSSIRIFISRSVPE